VTILTKTRFLVGGLIIPALLLFSTNTFAEWRIDIESKTVNAGETGVTVDFTGYWDLGVAAVVVPVVVREIDPGAFWTGQLPIDTAGGVAHGVQWKWANPGWASLIQTVKPAAPTNNPILWCCPGVGPCSDTLYDGDSPDQFVVAAGYNRSIEPAHPAGQVFLTLTFDVTSNAGNFEFDTACYLAVLNTVFVIDGTTWEDHGPMGTGEVVFNKGIITIVADCNCEHQGDCYDDGVINPVDVVYMINYGLRMAGPSPPSDPSCPLINRGDWDCSGQINLIDIIKMINYVYRQPAPGPCDPCEE